MPQQLMDIVAGLQQDHAQSAAKYQKMLSAGQTLASVRKALDGLAALGDTVTQEDVIKASGKLVAAGLTPVAIAGLLADMPPEGEALQAWVQAHDQQTQQREAQLAQATALARHQMGLAAAHVLQAHSVAGRQMAMSAGQGQGPNDGMAPGPALGNALASPGDSSGPQPGTPSLIGAPNAA